MKTPSIHERRLEAQEGWNQSLPGERRPTCRGGVCVVRLLGQVEDLFPGVRGRDGILPLPSLHGIILLPVIVSVVELLKPLDKIQVVLETPFHQLLHRNYLQHQVTT